MPATIICQLIEVRSFINASQDKIIRARFEFAATGQEEERRKLDDLCLPAKLIYMVAMTEDEYKEAVRKKTQEAK